MQRLLHKRRHTACLVNRNIWAILVCFNWSERYKKQKWFPFPISHPGESRIHRHERRNQGMGRDNTTTSAVQRCELRSFHSGISPGPDMLCIEYHFWCKRKVNWRQKKVKSSGAFQREGSCWCFRFEKANPFGVLESSGYCTL